MATFIDTLNESTVTFVTDMATWGWTDTSEGWEAIAPSGEVRVFHTYKEAQQWRLAEVKDSFDWSNK